MGVVLRGNGAISITCIRTVSQGSSRSGNVFYIHTDHQGSVIAQTNNVGNVIEKYTYSPFGENSNLLGTTIGYTGQRYDSEKGLYYYRARHYSPALGRFLQPDPLGYGPGMNMYGYVHNDPVNRTDSSGTVDDDFLAARRVLGSAYSLNDAVTTPAAFITAGIFAYLGGAGLAAANESIVMSSLGLRAGALLGAGAAGGVAGVGTLGISRDAIASGTYTGKEVAYRAVMNAEKDDILATGQFLNRGPTGPEIKYFAPTAEQAARYAKAAFGKFGDTSEYTTVRATAPMGTFGSGTGVERGITALTVRTEQLQNVTPTVRNYSALPTR